jgi:hypothetical protein
MARGFAGSRAGSIVVGECRYVCLGAGVLEGRETNGVDRLPALVDGLRASRCEPQSSYSIGDVSDSG